jgi:hypothetical protein
VAERLLGEGLYAVASTDLHVPDRAGEWIEAGMQALARRAGPGGLDRLMAANPRRILAGEELP